MVDKHRINMLFFNIIICNIFDDPSSVKINTVFNFNIQCTHYQGDFYAHVSIFM